MPFVDFGFRVVLSGPGQARAGEDVTYTLDYQRVSPNPKGWGNRFVIDYGIVNYAHPPQPPASLVAVQATAGASPTNLVPQIPGFSENCEFVGDSGTLQIIVCPAPGFAGPLTVRLYIKGTSIEFPPGSANEVTTQIGGS